MKKLLIAILPLALSQMAAAQNVGVNANGAAPDASALLDVDAAALPAAGKRGMLVPRIALTAANVAAPVVLPATSLLIYNTATAGAAPNNVYPGYYYWNGAAWVRFATGGDGWLTTGNYGTVVGTNWIGTNDAVDWVIKTGGVAAANERARVRANGQFVVNNTDIVIGDVFSVYSNNTVGTTASINNAAGNFAINGYASGSGTGVYGETAGGATTVGTAVWGDLYGTATSASGASEGVYGANSTAPAGTGATASIATGVRGEATGAAGTAFTMAVLGINTGTAGSAFGVYGQTASPAAMGVFGINTDVSANPAHGVQGQTAAVGSAAGLRGYNTAAAIGAGQNGFGVRGSVTAAPTGTGFVMGVRGDVGGATGSTYGAYGQSASATGFGMDAVNTNASGTGLIVTGNNAAGTYLGVGSGSAINGTGVGELAIAKTAASGVGVIGIGNNLVGSIFAPATGAGVVGVGAQYGLMGFATTTVVTAPGTNSAASGANASAGGYFEVQNAGVAQTWAYVGVREVAGAAGLRKIIGPGTVNTVVKEPGGNRVALSCPEAPENFFQDYGAGQLINGRAHIELDPILAVNIIVSDAHPLRVFVQLEGDCNGVYVTNKTGSGFDVIELAGGTSSTPFSWTITANRADEVNPDGSIAHYSAERFPAAPGPQTKTLLATVTQDDSARKVPVEPAQEMPVVRPHAKRSR